MKELFYTPTKQELIEHVINAEDIYGVVYKYDGNLEDPKHISTNEIMRIENTDSMINLYNFIRSSALYFPDFVDIDETKFKLKYLDKDDIESLGFDFYKNSPTGSKLYINENICLVYREDNNTIRTFTLDPISDEVGQFDMKLNIDYNCINRIIIKNKSELRKLLKQLNVK